MAHKHFKRPCLLHQAPRTGHTAQELAQAPACPAPAVAGGTVRPRCGRHRHLDSPSDQADAVVRTLARPARGARDTEKESEAEVGLR